MTNSEILGYEELEIDLVLEAIFQVSHYDYSNYSKAHIKRRLNNRLAMSGYQRYSDLIPDIIYNPVLLNTLLADLSINVTEMFRDPSFFKTIIEKVFPYIQTYPFIKIWHAGCSSGQEVYSMSILLREAGLYKNTQIYATDFSRDILKDAKEAIYPIEDIKKYTKNYREAGGHRHFVDYYTIDSNSSTAKISPELKDNILFSFHNLVTDGSFGEMNVICCRNVLIYFDRDLQNKVLELFYESLTPGGFLCLGSKESIKFSGIESLFETVSENAKIYRKRVLPYDTV